MTWNTPQTWVAGPGGISALLLNAQVRDNLKAIGDPWTDWTPTWSGATTNPVIGNGTIDAAYLASGKLTHFRILITMGSTTTYGSGQWRLTLPVLPTNQRWTFQGDGALGAGAYLIRGIWDNTSSLLTLATPGTTAGGADRTVTLNNPAAWGSGHTLSISGVYEGA